jgi:hypothetical protein
VCTTPRVSYYEPGGPLGHVPHVRGALRYRRRDRRHLRRPAATPQRRLSAVPQVRRTHRQPRSNENASGRMSTDTSRLTPAEALVRQDRSESIRHSDGIGWLSRGSRQSLALVRVRRGSGWYHRRGPVRADDGAREHMALGQTGLIHRVGSIFPQQLEVPDGYAGVPKRSQTQNPEPNENSGPFRCLATSHGGRWQVACVEPA